MSAEEQRWSSRSEESREMVGGACKKSYTVKKITDFPVPSRDVTNLLFLARKSLVIVTYRLGTGKSVTFFMSL